ncbi:MAG: Gfo/Idh/MocA family protein [Thermoproteota archaeon]
MLKLAFIGAGRISYSHAEALSKIKNVSIVGVADVSEQAAKAFSEKYKCSFYTDYLTMVEKTKPDAVIIATPHAYHAKQAVDCMKNKIHVLVEKPMCVSAREAEEMINTSKKNSVKLMVGHTHRFISENVVAKKLIEDREIGEVFMISDRIYGSGFYTGYPKWFGKKELSGGGIFMNNGPHAIDRVVWWFGERPTKVSAKVGRFCFKDVDVEDNGVATLYFKKGIANIILTWSAPKAASCATADIFGTEGMLRVATWSSVELMKGEELKKINYEKKDQFYEEDKAFIESVINDTDPPVTGEDGMLTVKVIEKIYEASEREEVVSL